MAWDMVVVGGGPAGLFAAIAAAERGARALVLEHMSNPGRKLLASGGGQCNLTHGGEIMDFLPHYGGGTRPGEAGRFLRPALYAFSNRDLVTWCTRWGVPLTEDPDGRVFPISRRAQDVLDLLLAEARRRRVELRTGVRVRSLRVERSRFVVLTAAGQKPVVEGLTLVLATGGRSYPSLGATGDGYRLAASLGHSVVSPRPALAPVVIERNAFSPFVPCAGVSLPGAAVAVVREKRTIAEKEGDVLFTHRGLSGPAVLNLSRYVLPGDSVRVSPLAGSGSIDLAEQRLTAEIAAHGKRTVANLLQGLGLAACLSRALLAAVGLGPGTKAAELPREARHALASSLAAGGDGGHPFPVSSLGGWNEAMVTAGGVTLGEVDPKTMASRILPGLFFAGEVLDVDGDTGGYNLQAAFSTGRLAGTSAAGKARSEARRRVTR
jgi:predicted Rossmann fold flavoprotein